MAVESHPITARHDTRFEHAYPVEAPDLRSLYEKAKRDQWNVSKDIDWAQPFDIEQGVLADEMMDIYGTPFWDRLTPAERGELNMRFANWRLGVLLYGEHGAMLLCSQLVECVSGTDAKFFQATQVVDEARHNEVLNRYVTERMGGLRYPLPDFERELFDTLLSDSRWTVKTIGLQLVAETFAVALFRMLAETSKDPLLKQICKFILQDESRHMGFGMLSLPDVVGQMTDAERAELEEVTHWALVKTLTGQFPEPVFREIGFGDAEIKAIHTHRRERAAGAEGSHFRKLFRKDLHGTLLANLQKVGLLTERIRPRLESVGIRVPAL
ncbi:MAG TPA: ferritin-like domain-containing protein [Methylomirabilota bacterium]|jgi:P-aminobenzoate N-oxygenase AurF|nr:ferritin-like domain-containing protein [Methylomirabilota bacterium]